MAGEFNPYSAWLGIETGNSPPNHYELLRLPPFASDPDEVSIAAGAQMAKIRSIRPGNNAADWQRMLDELAAAKKCLGDPAAKARYDEQLRQKLGAGAGPKMPAAEQASGRLEPSLPRASSLSHNLNDDDEFQPGKNLLPPGRTGSGTKSKLQVDAEFNTGPALNPMPPTRSAKSPSEAPVGPSLESTNPMPPAPASLAATGPAARRPSGPGSQMPAPPSGPAPATPTTPMPAANQPPMYPAYPGGVPMYPGGAALGGTIPGGMAPGTPSAGPQAPFPGGYPPKPAAPFPGGPQPVAGAPQAPFMPARPIYPQPYPAPAAPWGGPVVQPPQGFAPGMPYPAAMPGGPGFQQGSPAAPMTPGGYPPPQNQPFPAPGQRSAPQGQPAGQQFFDDLMGDRSSPLDEIGLGDANQPTAATPTQGPNMPAAAVAFDSASGPQATDPHDDVGSAPSVRRRPPSRQQHSSQIALVAVGIAVAAVVIVGAVLIINSRRDNDIVAGGPGTTNPTTTTTRASAAATTTSLNKPKPPVQPHEKPNTPGPAQSTTGTSEAPPVAPTAPEKSPTPEPMPMKEPAPPVKQPMPEPPKPMPVDPAVLAKIRRNLATARTKLGERNQEAAKKLIAEASQLATTPELQETVERVDALEKYVGEFWSAVRDSVKSLKATDEIDLPGTKAIVVEASADSLTVHVTGSNRKYQVNQLPAGIAVGLALRWLDAKKPENKVFVGAFYLVDPKMGPERARQEWKEAADAGVDVKNLLPLLEPEKPEAAAPTADASNIAAVPEPDELAKAEKTIKDEFERSPSDLSSPGKKLELAKRLLEQGGKRANLAERYALWCRARDLAAEEGEPKTMIEAVDRLTGQFHVDGLDMKADALANSPAKTPDAARAFNEAAIKLAEEASAAKRNALADRFMQIALVAARATNAADVVQRTQQRAKELQEVAGAPGA